MVNKMVDIYKKQNIIIVKNIDTDKKPEKLNNKASKTRRLDISRINN